jgi:hypothetical protein
VQPQPYFVALQRDEMMFDFREHSTERHENLVTGEVLAIRRYERLPDGYYQGIILTAHAEDHCICIIERRRAINCQTRLWLACLTHIHLSF